MNKDKFEFKFGGKDGGQTIYAATKLLDYINSLEPHKIYAISNMGKGVVILSKNEMVFADTIKQTIKTLEKRIDYLNTELSKIAIEIDKGTESEIDNLYELEYRYEEEIKGRKSQKEILQEILQSGGIINE